MFLVEEGTIKYLKPEQVVNRDYSKSTTTKLQMNNNGSNDSKNNPFYKQAWFWLIIALIILGYLCFSKDRKEKEITRPSIGYYF
jgi:cell division protein FtsW (lipid II flippase)